MASLGVQLVGYILGLLGLLGTLVAMLLPSWRISSYVGASIVTAVGFSKGLWMECATHSTGITQCDIYSTLLGLPADIQAAQAMMVTSSAFSSLACMISVVGMRCTVFCKESQAKDRVAVVGGVFFILGGLLGFIPVAWNLHGILRDFYSPLVPDSMKYEIGEALYLGIISSLFSLVAGIILCFSCSTRGNRTNYYDGYQAQPLATRSSPRPGQQPKAKSEFNSYSLTGKKLERKSRLEKMEEKRMAFTLTQISKNLE
ncbi:PREDICTED: claudin-2 isoform X1 [Dipodomys ordii]|uniref:Claudin-2 isoform X1 n=1 Tax=Dipodomys ordii TaxID=10020 RepID=A0A1S3FZ76_DIPOR|nr:PREDICTED: claudin-2 isoform X1 [Dipodomys ordii]